MRAPFLPVAAIALAVTVAMSACGDGGDDVDGAQSPARVDRAALVDELCAAARHADTGDVDAARAQFDDVHHGLHDVADEVAAADREAGAHLLRAKHAVEADLQAAPADRLARDLRALVAAIPGETAGAAPASCG